MEGQTIRNRDRKPELQVMICTYGRDGLRRIASSQHPEVEGVEYLVSVQHDPDDDIYPIPKELDRVDFRLFPTPTRGLSVNRNMALSLASAPILLISDDDVEYTENGLRSVIDAFHEHKDADIITFRFASDLNPKTYPDLSYEISSKNKHFISSIEIAFRRKSVQGRIWFNENFGVGATFPYGEEDIFLQDCMDAGLKCRYIPITIARHEGATTSGRNMMLATRPLTKGAVFMRLHPYDWPLRMMAHTIREIPLWRKGLVPSPFSYCLNWLKGARKACIMKVFPTPDHSLHYPYHELPE